jgi:hypothetical protein
VKEIEEVVGGQQRERLIEGKEGKGDDYKEEEVKNIGSLNPLEDFKKMVSDRKTDRVGQAIC